MHRLLSALAALALVAAVRVKRKDPNPLLLDRPRRRPPPLAPHYLAGIKGKAKSEHDAVSPNGKRDTEPITRC